MGIGRTDKCGIQFSQAGIPLQQPVQIASGRNFQSIERLAKGIEMLSLEKKPTGIIEGYRLARSRSLKELGRELMGIYGRVLPRP